MRIVADQNSLIIVSMAMPFCREPFKSHRDAFSLELLVSGPNTGGRTQDVA